MQTNSKLISVVCPSRGRPAQLSNMVESALKHAAEPQNIEFCIYIDIDDDSYSRQHGLFQNSKVKFLKGPRLWLSLAANTLLTITEGDYIFWCGDDVEFKTNNWDLILKNEIDSFQDKLCVAYPNDMANYEQKYATNGMVHREWINLFGHLFTPHMRDNGTDFWISDVAASVGRLVYRNDVLVEHKQYRQGKSNLDQTYIDRRKTHRLYSPVVLYRDLRNERRRDKLILSYKINKPLKINSLRYLLVDLIVKLGSKNIFRNTENSKLIYIRAMSTFSLIEKFFNKFSAVSKYRNWK